MKNNNLVIVQSSKIVPLDNDLKGYFSFNVNEGQTSIVFSKKATEHSRFCVGLRTGILKTHVMVLNEAVVIFSTDMKNMYLEYIPAGTYYNPGNESRHDYYVSYFQLGISEVKDNTLNNYLRYLKSGILRYWFINILNLERNQRKQILEAIDTIRCNTKLFSINGGTVRLVKYDSFWEIERNGLPRYKTNKLSRIHKSNIFQGLTSYPQLFLR